MSDDASAVSAVAVDPLPEPPIAADPVQAAIDTMLKAWSGIKDDFSAQIDAQVQRLAAIVQPSVTVDPIPAPVPVVIHMPAPTEWQTLDSAPKATAEKPEPIPVLLFIPFSKEEETDGRRVVTKANEYVVGWWDVRQSAWCTSAFQNGGQPVYPSRWQALPADPVKA